MYVASRLAVINRVDIINLTASQRPCAIHGTWLTNGVDTPTAMETHTFIVVSHADLRRHKDARELINIPGYQQWKQAYHECIFTPSGTEDIDSQMRQVHTRNSPVDPYFRLYANMPINTPLSINCIRAKLLMFIPSWNVAVLFDHAIVPGLQIDLTKLHQCLSIAMYLPRLPIWHSTLCYSTIRLSLDSKSI